MSTRGWTVEHAAGRARELHAASAQLAASATSRVVRLLESSVPALVLGSSQPDTDVDQRAAAAAGVDVVRRSSGGGAVLTTSESVVWVDLIVPSGDPLWDDDVGKAAWWVGDLWADVIREVVGTTHAQVWKSAMRKTRWSAKVCFAGMGPGEVLLGGGKVVGISQRRTRAATLFQTAAVLDWDVATLLGLLSLDEAAKSEAERELRSAAAGVGLALRGALVDTLVGGLPE